jgi:hypothetical protein
LQTEQANREVEKRDSTVRNLSAELTAASSTVHENIQQPRGKTMVPTSQNIP